MVKELKENFLLNCAFPMADKAMGTCAMKWYRQIVMMSEWSSQKVLEWQTIQMKKLVEHAYCHTRYYREVMDGIGLKPQDIVSLDDLKLFPVLDRDTIKERFADLIPDNIKNYPHRKSSTGGSTGEPLQYICDENTWGFVTAMKIFSWKKFGYHYGDKFVSLGSSSLFPTNKRSLVHEIYFRLKNTIPLNGMNMDDATCAKYMDIIRKRDIHYIYGYATAIYLLARYCRENGVQWHFDVAFPTAEKLTPLYRETITDTWGARVMDCYGSKDGGITAYEIEPGVYHVGYASWLEASEEEPSELYATNLVDFAFPTIRYANRDEVMMWNQNVDSKYNGQLLREVVGRTSDIILFDNGHKLTTSGFTILFRDLKVEAYRIIKTGGMSVSVQVQKGKEYTQTEHDLLKDTIRKYVGEGVDITIEYVTAFEPLKNGKRSFMYSQ